MQKCRYRRWRIAKRLLKLALPVGVFLLWGPGYSLIASGVDSGISVESLIPANLAAATDAGSSTPGNKSGPFDLPMFLNEDPFFTWQEFDQTIENPIFQNGEVLTYSVSWMGINAGSITMTLDVNSSINGRPAVKMIVTGSTNKTFSRFFKVKDVITSYMDPHTFNSLHYVKDIREGKYRKIQETSYDLENGKARVKEKEYPLPPNSKDPIACIYALRRFRPDKDVVIRMNSNSEGKNNYPVEIAFGEKTTIKLGDGVTREAVIGKPLPTWEGRVFEKKRSTVVMWLSHDQFAVPMKLETKVKIGTLKAELIYRTGPGWQLNLEKEEK